MSTRYTACVLLSNKSCNTACVGVDMLQAMTTKTIPWHLVEDLLKARDRDRDWLQRELQAAPQVVTNWKTRGVPKGRASEVAKALGTTSDYLLQLPGATRDIPTIHQVQQEALPYAGPERRKTPAMQVLAGNPGDDGVDVIPLVEAKGSCGGGYLNFDPNGKEPLVKEARWFRHHGVKPENTMAIYADGDSMANFIVDGDIVIFDRAERHIVSGTIYVVDTPDGLRIKRIHRRADGTVVLSSDSANKTRYPDEIYSPEQAEHLNIVGKFVYRQGGG